MRFRVPVAAATAVVAWVLWTAPVFTGIADPILDWNLVTLQTIRELRLPPPRASRVLAMVHAATFDAVNGIELTFEPYYVTRPAVPGASADAAAAAAAHGVLTGVFPDAGPYFDAQLAVSLSGVRPPAARNKGVAWGRFVAGQILKLRRDDGSDAVVVYTPSGEFGRWEPTPPGFADALLPQWPQVTPFVMWSGGALRPVEPPELSSLEFATAFLEVKELGSVASVLRTADETQIAFFWEDGPGSATPPGHWQIIAREFAVRAGTSVVDNARLFALLSLVQADAAIAAWDSKYHHDHFRPHTGITRADEDGNDSTDPDPFWMPLLPTPPFPSYVSGHSVFSGASAEILALYFGDVPFSSAAPDPQIWPDALYDDEGQPVVRHWPSLSHAADEAGMSRIYGGLHWQYDNVRGLSCGRELAQFAFANWLRPRR